MCLFLKDIIVGLEKIKILYYIDSYCIEKNVFKKFEYYIQKISLFKFF